MPWQPGAATPLSWRCQQPEPAECSAEQYECLAAAPAMAAQIKLASLTAPGLLLQLNHQETFPLSPCSFQLPLFSCTGPKFCFGHSPGGYMKQWE